MKKQSSRNNGRMRKAYLKAPGWGGQSHVSKQANPNVVAEYKARALTIGIDTYWLGKFFHIYTKEEVARWADVKPFYVEDAKTGKVELRDNAPPRVRSILQAINLLKAPDNFFGYSIENLKYSKLKLMRNSQGTIFYFLEEDRILHVIRRSDIYTTRELAMMQHEHGRIRWISEVCVPLLPLASEAGASSPS